MRCLSQISRMCAHPKNVPASIRAASSFLHQMKTNAADFFNFHKANNICSQVNSLMASRSKVFHSFNQCILSVYRWLRIICHIYIVMATFIFGGSIGSSVACHETTRLGSTLPG